MGFPFARLGIAKYSDTAVLSLFPPSPLFFHLSLLQAEQAARIKAEKIKIALEKMKEASVQKVALSLYTFLPPILIFFLGDCIVAIQFSGMVPSVLSFHRRQFNIF